MRKALIENGLVASVIEVDPASIPDWAMVLPDAGAAGPGWSWDGEAFAPPPEPPEPDPAEVLATRRARMTLSFAQFLIALEEVGWITTAEAEAWLAGSALPALADAVIAALPGKAPDGRNEQLRARARALRPTVIERMNPLLLAMAAAKGVTDDEVDAIFVDFAQV